MALHGRSKPSTVQVSPSWQSKLSSATPSNDLAPVHAISTEDEVAIATSSITIRLHDVRPLPWNVHSCGTGSLSAKILAVVSPVVSIRSFCSSATAGALLQVDRTGAPTAAVYSASSSGANDSGIERTPTWSDSIPHGKVTPSSAQVSP